jgi:hypothetical protein
MSLLHQEFDQELDDAARGEAYTKGSSHVIWAGIIAAVLVSIAVTFYVLAGEKRPVASGEIVQMWTHSLHATTTGIDANGEAMAKQSLDQVLVFAHVKLKNQSPVPLFLQDVLANVKLGDGILSVSSGSQGQYDEAFLAYPQLAALHAKALPARLTIAPGESVDGDVFWAVRLTKQEWDARKDLNFTFVFLYQQSLVLAPRTAVMER